MPKKTVTKVITNVKSNLSPMRWGVWIFPFFAIVIAGWLVYDFYANRGPEITISFEDAAGVEAEKTSIKYRGIIVGKVESVTLADDTKKVSVKARLKPDAKHLAVDDSKFWIVVPEVGFAGVSGLETIFQGPYIRVEPGKGKPAKDFKGAENDAGKDPESGTVSYWLTTSLGDSISPGNPVTFRGLKIGSVSAVKLGSHAREVRAQISVEREFVKVIRTNTVFWRKVGVKADLGLFGAEIKINSIESLLKGGIALATPNDAGPIANAGEKFPLQEEPPKKWEDWDPKLNFN